MRKKKDESYVRTVGRNEFKKEDRWGEKKGEK